MSKDTVTRAVTIPVSGVVEGTWRDFMTHLHELWRQTTCASNWTVQFCARQDNIHEIKSEKFPACPKLYAYPHLTPRFPDLSTGTLASIGKAVETRYRQHRFHVWRGTEALPVYRYPAPFPVRKQDWNPVWVNDERPGVMFSTGQPRNHNNGHRWTLILQGGPEFRRQTRQFEQIISGEAGKCDMAIYRQRCGDTHRNQTSQRQAGGHQNVSYRVMCKLVAKFPKKQVEDASGALVLCTHPEAFWVAMHDGREVRPWIMNEDQTQRWREEMRMKQREYAAWRQRMSEDQKMERRLSRAPIDFGRAGSRPQMADAWSKRQDKHRRRVNTWICQATAMVVNYCVRNRLAGIMYDDTDQRWVESFPWAQVRTQLRQRCDAEGLYAGGTLEAGEGGGDEIEEEAEE